MNVAPKSGFLDGLQSINPQISPFLMVKFWMWMLFSQESRFSMLHKGCCLVGGIPSPLKNMSSSVGMITFPTYRKIKFMFQTTNQYSNCSYLKCQFPALNRDSQSNHQTNSLNHQPVMDCCGRWWSNVQAPKSPSDPLPPSIFHIPWHGVFRGSVRGWWKGWDMLMPSGELLGVYLYGKKDPWSYIVYIYMY